MNDNFGILSRLDRPTYVLDETLLRKNLRLIKDVSKRADVEVILAFKAYALWKTFPIFREYIGATTASSYSEARLAYEEFGSPAHTYSPAYTDYEIEDIARFSSHITFNSFSQYDRMREKALKVNPDISFGIRINPEYSEIENEILVQKGRVSVLLLKICRLSCRRILRVFIVIVIAKVDLMCLSVLWCI